MSLLNGAIHTPGTWVLVKDTDDCIQDSIAEFRRTPGARLCVARVSNLSTHEARPQADLLAVGWPSHAGDGRIMASALNTTRLLEQAYMKLVQVWKVADRSSAEGRKLLDDIRDGLAAALGMEPQQVQKDIERKALVRE
jgi:hypothetical protein